ncbi:unnamed protein product [Angiostrongylus costaricensis]|uniref:Uncharacterized protein n=1 Tax=Angiostrongylus costaricensis TaxID=334426 RepID=A0A0R3PN67_ANGCS|nr:unnamed protein product [Angiostrongylus costaricensis]
MESATLQEERCAQTSPHCQAEVRMYAAQCLRLRFFPQPASLSRKNDRAASELGKQPSTTSTSSSSSTTNEGRKRRRGEVANPANTLDGLVARRADDTLESFQKRCLSEQEAIEGPDDELEANVMT